MRMWELDDVRALPGEIVREQDFIMKLRHLHRQNASLCVVNLSFGALPTLQVDTEKREAVLREIASILAGQEAQAQPQLHNQIYAMSQGDAFILATVPPVALLAMIDKGLLAAGITDASQQAMVRQLYQLPQDYDMVRERTNHYIEAARAAAQIGAANPTPELALQGDQVRGALTPWALDQIVKLFATIDVRRYVRHQTIYRDTPHGWQQAGAEYFVSVDELRRERFPRLDIRHPERLFMELCSELDHRLLGQFAEQPTSLGDQAVAQGQLNLNIAVETVLGKVFANFTHALTTARRAAITFELNRGDLLLNLTTTQNAIALLKQEGYQVALDALSPALLPLLNCAMFGVDWFKIRVGKDVLAQFDSAETMRAFKALPTERVIFYRCDNEAALTIGRQMGVKLFQGWYIDDVAGH